MLWVRNTRITGEPSPVTGDAVRGTTTIVRCAPAPGLRDWGRERRLAAARPRDRQRRADDGAVLVEPAPRRRAATTPIHLAGSGHRWRRRPARDARRRGGGECTRRQPVPEPGADEPSLRVAEPGAGHRTGARRRGNDHRADDHRAPDHVNGSDDRTGAPTPAPTTPVAPGAVAPAPTTSDPRRDGDDDDDAVTTRCTAGDATTTTTTEFERLGIVGELGLGELGLGQRRLQRRRLSVSRPSFSQRDARAPTGRPGSGRSPRGVGTHSSDVPSPSAPRSRVAARSACWRGRRSPGAAPHVHGR